MNGSIGIELLSGPQTRPAGGAARSSGRGAKTCTNVTQLSCSKNCAPRTVQMRSNGRETAARAAALLGGRHLLEQCGCARSLCPLLAQELIPLTQDSFTFTRDLISLASHWNWRNVSSRTHESWSRPLPARPALLRWNLARNAPPLHQSMPASRGHVTKRSRDLPKPLSTRACQ